MLSKLLTQTNGLMGALVGIIVALSGCVVKETTVHQKTGSWLFTFGALLLVVGSWVYLTGSTTKRRG